MKCPLLALALLALTAPAAGAESKLVPYRHDATVRFSLSHPLPWTARPAAPGPILVRLGDGTGTQCSISFNAQKKPPGAYDLAAARAAYLETITAERMKGIFGDKVRVEVKSVAAATLGGLAARRIEMRIGVQADPNAGLLQWVTLIEGGALALNCAAPAERFDSAATRADFAAIHKSFALR